MATQLAAGTEPHWRAVPSLLLHHCARLVCCLAGVPHTAQHSALFAARLHREMFPPDVERQDRARRDSRP